MKRWVVFVDLAGRPTEPKPFNGPDDEDAYFVQSSGACWRGIGHTWDEAIRSAQQARQGTLPTIERCIGRLRAAMAGGWVDPDAAHIDPSLLHELREYLGAGKVPFDTRSITWTMAWTWLADLEAAVQAWT